MAVRIECMTDGRFSCSHFQSFTGTTSHRNAQIGKTTLREHCYLRFTPAIFQSLYGSVRVDLPLLKRGMFSICDVVT